VATLAWAGDYKIGALTIKAPWSRPAMAGMNGVGFMTIANAGPTPVTLLRAESAGRRQGRDAQLVHVGQRRDEHAPRDDKGVVVPAGGQVAFASGGYHFMLLGLKQPQDLGAKSPRNADLRKWPKIARWLN
jgi:copper(I)-binding protein